MVAIRAKVKKVKRLGRTEPVRIRCKVKTHHGPKPDLDRVQVSEEELEASVCRDDFFEFVKAAWHTVIPEDPVWNWHIRYLCRRLQELAEDVFAGRPKKNDLVINIPPGMTKSTVCSVMFPAWIWTRMRHARFIGASYAHQLAMDLARKCRDVVLSDWYRSRFPEVQLRDDQNTKCLAKGTQVLLADGATKAIEDIVAGDRVQSSDGTKRTIDTVVAVMDSGVKEVVRLTLSDGTEVVATPEHRLYGKDGWQFVRDMKEGDLLRVVRKTADQSGDLSADDAFLLAVWLAEGTKRCTGFRLTNNNQQIHDRLRRICEERGWTFRSDDGLQVSLSMGYKQDGDTPVAFLRKFGLYNQVTTETIRIPAEVMRATTDVVREFVGAYVACDGTVTGRSKEVRITTNSEGMASDFRMLLKRLGVQCNVRGRACGYRIGSGEYKETGVAYGVYVKRRGSILALEGLPLYGKDERLAVLVAEKKAYLDNPPARGHNPDVALKVSDDIEFRTIVRIAAEAPTQTYDIQTRRYNAFFAGGVLSHNSYFATTAGGYRYAVGTNGSVLGMHAHFIVIDDPIDPESAESELDLKAANRWIKTTLSTRKVNKQVSVTVLVMQRLHQDDPTANFLAQPKVAWVKLPAELADGCEPKELATRYRDGLLDPVRLSWDTLEEERSKGEQYYAAQFRQHPVPPGGAVFDVRGVKRGTPPGKWARLVRFWDKAASAGKGDWTVGLLLGVDPGGRVWVLDVVRGRWDSHRREEVIVAVAAGDGDKVLIGVEQEPGSGGKESAEATVRRLGGYRVRVVKVDATTGGKERRADPVSYQVNGGNLHLPDTAPWAEAFLKELEFFPHGRHDDQVDALSGAYNLVGKVRRPAGGLGAGYNQVIEVKREASVEERLKGLLEGRAPRKARVTLGGSRNLPAAKT